MYTIKMESDKTLTTTVHSILRQGETNVDNILFILPKEYNGIDMSECVVTLKYILPDGTGCLRNLDLYDDPYNDKYYQYHFEVTSALTVQEGEIELWLTVINANKEAVLVSGTTIIEILPAKDVTDYFPAAELNQLDRLIMKVAELEDEKADNISFDEDERKLQLTSNGEYIGDAIDTEKMSGNIDIIYFDDIEIDIEGGG